MVYTAMRKLGMSTAATALLSNKRGGEGLGRTVDAYSKKYAVFIERQINLLAPDVIVVIGRMIYPMREGNLRVWHTAYSMPWIESVEKTLYCDHRDEKVDLYM